MKQDQAPATSCDRRTSRDWRSRPPSSSRSLLALGVHLPPVAEIIIGPRPDRGAQPLLIGRRVRCRVISSSPPQGRRQISPDRSRLRNRSAAARAEHLGDRDELLARAALAGPRRLGRLDPLPVAEGDDVDAARVEQARRARPAPPCGRRPGRGRRRSSRRPHSRRAGWCRSCRSARAAPSRRNRGRRRSPRPHWRSGRDPPHRATPSIGGVL